MLRHNNPTPYCIVNAADALQALKIRYFYVSDLIELWEVCQVYRISGSTLFPTNFDIRSYCNAL
jgi:hypothetical protein